MSRRVYTKDDIAKRTDLQARAAEQDFSEKVVKHVPTEIIAVWTALDGQLATASPNLYWGMFLFLALLVPVYIWRFTTEKDLGPAKRQILVATGAFVVWVFGMGGPFKTIMIPNPAAAVPGAAADIAQTIVWYQPFYGTLALALASIMLVIILKEKAVSDSAKPQGES